MIRGLVTIRIIPSSTVSASASSERTSVADNQLA